MNTTELPLAMVEVPTIVKREIKKAKLDGKGKQIRNFRGGLEYEIKMVEEAKVIPTAMRVAPKDIPTIIAEAQAKVDEVLNPFD